MGNMRFLLTGGPGSGKTTTIEELRALGHRTTPDVARALIQERRKEGLAPRPDPATFGREILAAEIRQYDAVPADRGLVFFDRGIPDALCMTVACNSMSMQQATEILDARPYNPIAFLFSPVESMYLRDSERDQTFEEATLVSEEAARFYTAMGFHLVKAPLLPPRERAAFFLSSIAALPIVHHEV
jgi:predicted ATPase